MSIQHKSHLDAQAKEVEGKLQASLGELAGDTDQNLQGDAQQAQAFALKVGQVAEETFKPQGLLEVIPDARALRSRATPAASAGP